MLKTTHRSHHAFKVTDEDFDVIFGHIKDEGIAYGRGPPNPVDDMTINHRGGGRGVYFRDPDGHILELLTPSKTLNVPDASDADAAGGDRVALARRLLVALWRYREEGELPEGAELKAAG